MTVDSTAILDANDVNLIRKNLNTTKLKLYPKLPKSLPELHIALNKIEVKTNRDEDFMVWNQHAAALANNHKTNNISEGWHNRFFLIVGRYHPDLYSALQEIRKEQAATEVALAELSMGKRIQNMPKKKWLELQTQIRTITSEYNDSEDKLDF
ncbi:hypothetical protein V9T40_003419 [Parthenolecanium corni]|uniref:Uncharacterized protein n=1 Tax=Parthenolecanium corni TaxID=536013 RepID=A0AAN9TQN3_9HEMI